MTNHYVSQGPKPPSDVMVETGDLLALRVHGRARSPLDGKHREVVVFVQPTMTPNQLAILLRGAADRLDPHEAALGATTEKRTTGLEPATLGLGSQCSTN